MEEFDKIARVDHTAVRPEITGPVLDHSAGKKHLRKVSRTDAYPWISLGVLEQDVVTGLELLDKVVFQQQSIRLRLDDSILGVGYLGYHDRGLACQSLCRHKILRHSLVQVLSLTYIYDIPLGVIIPIDTGGMREKFYFVFYFHGI